MFDKNSDKREVSCVWCGLKFESTIQSQADHLYKHAEGCEKHPIKPLIDWKREQEELLMQCLIKLRNVGYHGNLLSGIEWLILENDRLKKSIHWQTAENIPEDKELLLYFSQSDNRSMEPPAMIKVGCTRDFLFRKPSHWMNLPEKPDHFKNRGKKGDSKDE